MLFYIWMFTFLLSMGTGVYSSCRFLQPETARRGKYILFQIIAGVNYIIFTTALLIMAWYIVVMASLNEILPFWLLGMTCVLSIGVARSALRQAETLQGT